MPQRRRPGASPPSSGRPLLAGALFWLGGALFCWLTPQAREEWLLYAGLTVPVLGLVVAQLQRARLMGHPGYAALAGVATITELTALPTMFLVRDSMPQALPAILMISDGAHLLVLMWLHLDYVYFLAANVKVVLGVALLFTDLWKNAYPPQLVASGLVSLVAAVLVWRDSERTASLYVR